MATVPILKYAVYICTQVHLKLCHLIRWYISCIVWDRCETNLSGRCTVFLFTTHTIDVIAGVGYLGCGRETSESNSLCKVRPGRKQSASHSTWTPWRMMLLGFVGGRDAWNSWRAAWRESKLRETCFRTPPLSLRSNRISEISDVSISLYLSLGSLYVIDTFWKIVATMSNFLNLTACNVAPPMVGNCRNQRGTFPQRVEWLMGEWLGSGAVCPSARNSLNGASTAGYLYLFSEAFEVAFACRMTSTLPGWQEKLSGGSQKWLLKYGQCLL